MSSASKGRYQSKLFNFFHKQSRRFGEGFGRSLRQLKVATSWSLEALSKSIYLLLQKAVDSAGNQLPGAEQQRLYLQTSQIAADTGIVRVIENVETHYIPSLSSQLSLSTSKSPSAKIQGIASQLSSQNLVLVDEENKILDVLTASQQQALENQIISEIADYWRSWRLSQEETTKKLASPTNSFFKRLNFSQLNSQKPEKSYLQINPATVASLDKAVANLETNLQTNALVPVSRAQSIVKQRSSQLVRKVKTKLNIFLYGKQSVNPNQLDIVIDSNLETQKSKIKTLIAFSLNYFYKQPGNQKIKPTPTRPYFPSTQSPNPQLQSEASANDWLTSADLFGGGFPQLNANNQSSEKLFKRFQLPNWRTSKLKEKAGLQPPQKSMIKTGATSQKITITPSSELQNQNQGKITSTNQSTEVEAKPEWIETKAEIVGYQKHPLEQILAWIDNTMLKIEETIAKFAKVLQQLWRK